MLFILTVTDGRNAHLGRYLCDQHQAAIWGFVCESLGYSLDVREV